MFNIGTPELILILIVALMVIGPKKLPEMSRTIGNSVKEFRKATSDFQRSLEMTESKETVTEEKK